jgi:hypothetical protein
VSSVAIPAFTESGDLPAGVFKASLKQAIARFGSSSDRRKALGRRLERIHDIAVQTNQLARFVMFGSFVTAKGEPNDVDVFMIMSDNFDVGSLTGEAGLLFDHRTAQSHFGCSVFWIRRLAAIGGEQAAIEDWQIKRDGAERGVVEITGE